MGRNGDLALDDLYLCPGSDTWWLWNLDSILTFLSLSVPICKAEIANSMNHKVVTESE